MLHLSLKIKETEEELDSRELRDAGKEPKLSLHVVSPAETEG